MKLNMFLLLSLPIFVIAQDSLISKQRNENGGIHFEQGLSWEDIKLKSKAEGKPIFMDCYATWCGPCKFMSQNIFTQKAVGDFMNENFINVAVQMDRTSRDVQEIQKWYDDATYLESVYFISEYPTYLFFAPDGNPLHRFVGTTGSDPQGFIVKVKEALDPDKQYYTQIEKFQLHLHDSVFLHNELKAALKFGDRKSSERLANAYFNCIQDPYNVESLNLIISAVQSSNDKAFLFFLNNFGRIDSVIHDQWAAEYIVGNIIAREEIVPSFEKNGSIVNWSEINKSIKQKYPAGNAIVLQAIYQVYEFEIINKELRAVLYNDSVYSPDWNRIAAHIKKMCPGYNPDSIITMEKPRFYTDKKMQSECDRATLSCLEKYGSKLHAYDLNSILWEQVFLHSNDPKLLSLGTKLARRMVPDLSDTSACRRSGVPNLMDTYANLLYKTGIKEQAILWEQGALSAIQSDTHAAKSTLKNLEITIDKMERGESTWEGRAGAREEFKE